MALYVDLRAGCYRFLMPADAVVDVWVEDTARGRAPVSGPTQEWRGETLPLRSVHDLLGATGLDGALSKRMVKLACRWAPASPAFVLAVGGQHGFRDIDESEFRPLPPLLVGASALFDAALAVPVDGHLLLRWRRGAPNLSDQPTPAASALRPSRGCGS